MKRKFLEDLGLEKDVIDKIMSEAGKDITDLKAQIDDLNEQVGVKDITIKNKNDEISKFKEVDVEAIKKSEYERGMQDDSKEVEVFKKQNALDKALQGYKAKDTSILSKMLDMDSFSIVLF